MDIFGILNFDVPTAWPDMIWQNHVLIIVLIVCRKQSKKQLFMVKGAMYPNLMIR
jgi:hypothetical protein